MIQSVRGETCTPYLRIHGNTQYTTLRSKSLEERLVLRKLRFLKIRSTWLQAIGIIHYNLKFNTYETTPQKLCKCLGVSINKGD